MRYALFAVVLAAGCASPAKVDTRASSPALASAPPLADAAAPSVEAGPPPVAYVEVRYGEPGDAAFLVVPSAGVEHRLFGFGHDADCVVIPGATRGVRKTSGPSISVACDPREGSVAIVSAPKLRVIKVEESGPVLAELTLGPVTLDATLRRRGTPSCGTPPAGAPVPLSIGVVRGPELQRIVRLEGARAKPIAIGTTIHESLRCRGWIGRTGEKAIYRCDGPDLLQTWTAAVEDAQVQIFHTHGDADGAGQEAVGAVRAACGKRFIIRAAAPLRDRDWAPMGSPNRCEAPCLDAQEDCEETCRVNHAGEQLTECAEKCGAPREACERKRCNPK